MKDFKKFLPLSLRPWAYESTSPFGAVRVDCIEAIKEVRLPIYTESIYMSVRLEERC
jgi:hypothetical protein